MNFDTPLENENATNIFENKNLNVFSKLIVRMDNLPLVSSGNTITKCLKTETNVLRSSSNQNKDVAQLSEGTDIVFQKKPHLGKKSNLGLQSLKTTLTNSTDSSEMSEVPQKNHLMQPNKRFNKMLVKMSTENAEYIGSSEEVELFGVNEEEPYQRHAKNLVENIEFPTNISSKNVSSSDHQMDYKPSSFRDVTKINHQVEDTNLSLNDHKNKSLDDSNTEIMLLKSLNLLDLVEFKKVEKEIHQGKVSDCKHQRARSRFVLNNTKSKNKAEPRNAKFKDNNTKRHISVSKSLFYSKNKVNISEGSKLASSSLSESTKKVGSRTPYKQFYKESSKHINMKSVSASTTHLCPSVQTDHSKASHVSHMQNKCALSASVSETSSCVESPVTTQSKKAFQSLKPAILDLRILSPHTKLDFVNKFIKRSEGVPEGSCYTVVKPNVKQQSVKKCLLDEFPDESSDHKNNGLAGQLIEKPVSYDSSGLTIASSNNSQNIIEVAEESNENIKKKCESICDSTDELDTVISLHSSSDEHSVLFWDSNEKSRDVVIFPSEVSRIKFEEGEQDNSSQNIYNSNFSTMEITDSTPSTSKMKRKEKVFHCKRSTKQSLLAREKKKILSAVQVRHNTYKKEKVLTHKESIANNAALLSMSDLAIMNYKPKQISIPMTSLETSEKTSIPFEDSAKWESQETKSISPKKKTIALPDGKQNPNKVSSIIHSCDYCNKEFKSNKEYNKHNLKCHSHNLFY